MENQKLNEQLQAIKKLNKENYDSIRKQIYLLSEALNKTYSRPGGEVEAVKEKEYTILSFTDGNCIFERNYIGNYVHIGTHEAKATSLELALEAYYIHSVRRESDGCVFQLNDNVYPNENKGKVIKIEWFYISGPHIILNGDKEGFWDLQWIKKAPIRKPILITEDGKEIFEGDNYSLFSVLTKANWQEGRHSIKHALEFSSEWKHFHTKEAKDEYIKWNKPMYSLRDVDDAAGPGKSGIITTLLSLNKI